LNGKSRDKYWQRIEIEFQEENLARSDLEMLDAYFEHKRFTKSKNKAL
jgi:hypothetical protein